jgi:hypothetical protein
MRPFRARSSITSSILDDLDASDDLDVAKDVANGRVVALSELVPGALGREIAVRGE